MIGQSKLINLIDKHISNSTMPRTVLLEGEWGCGKHTVAKYISDKLMMQLLDITDILNLETLEQITLSATPRVYLINCSSISVRDQNAILKFLEEPLKNSFILLLSENKSTLLNTVVNRCIVWSFEQYSIEELLSFAEDGVIPKFANTPGRVIDFSKYPIDDMYAFSEKVLLQISKANYSNILTIPNRISFKDEEDGFPFDIFTYMLINASCELYGKGAIPFSVYEKTNEFYNDCKIAHTNKKHLFEHYLIELKQLFDWGV